MANYVPVEHLGEPYGENRAEMTPTRRKMIHKHRKQADLYGPELPFKIGLFKKRFGNKPLEIRVICDKCGKSIYISELTKIVICKCGELLECGEDE